MQYQISFFSPNGNAENLACSYKQILPSLTPMVDLRKEAALHTADTYLVGFEFPGTSLDRIPEQVQKFMAQLDNKKILLFATTPLADEEDAYIRAEAALQVCLPAKCDYLGLFLCQGEVDSALIMKLMLDSAMDPHNRKLRHELSLCKKAKKHPNRQDTRMACRFLVQALRLEYF